MDSNPDLTPESTLKNKKNDAILEREGMGLSETDRLLQVTTPRGPNGSVRVPW